MIGRDGIAGLVCLAGALLLLAMTRGLPQSALVPIGPGFYPTILLIVTALLGAALVVTDLINRQRAAPPPGRYRLVVGAFAIFGAYVLALPLLGYRLATVLFVGAMQIALEPPQGNRWWVVVGVAIGAMVVTYYVFERYLSVLLPRGRLTGF